jgi:hypothetical protein
MDDLERRRRWTVGRVFGRLLLLGGAVIIGAGLYASTAGVPEWLLVRVADRINQGIFVFGGDSVRLDPFRGIVASTVTAHRKRVVGPAALDAGEVVLRLDPVARVRREFMLRRVKVKDGLLRPRFAFSHEVGDGGEPVLNARMHIELENCRVNDVTIDRLSCDMRGKGSVMVFENIVGTVSAGGMTGDIRGRVTHDFSTQILEGRLETAFDPHIVISIFDAWNLDLGPQIIRRFEFRGAPPRCEIRFRNLCTRQKQFDVDGRFWMQDCAYKGVGVLRADGDVTAHLTDTSSVVKLDSLLVVRKEGIAEGGFTLDGLSRALEFEGVSAIDPKALCEMIGIFTNRALDVFTFDGPVKIAAKGKTVIGDITKTDVEGTLRGRDIRLQRLHAEQCSFDMRMLGTTNSLSNVRGRAYGGKLSGAILFVLPEKPGTTNAWYMVEGRLEDADFAEIATSVMKSRNKDYKGRFALRITAQGLVGKGTGRTVSGEGTLGIKHGRVFMLPLFGGFTGQMTKIIPGLDFVLRQSDVDADFVIGDGKFRSEGVHILGDILSLKGVGDYHLDKRLKFDVQVKLMKDQTVVDKLIRSITWPISKLFEFRLQGSMNKPEWTLDLANLPRGLLEVLGVLEKRPETMGEIKDEAEEAVEIPEEPEPEEEPEKPDRRPWVSD